MVWKIRKSFLRKVGFEVGFRNWVVTDIEPSKYEKQREVGVGGLSEEQQRAQWGAGAQQGVY